MKPIQLRHEDRLLVDVDDECAHFILDLDHTATRWPNQRALRDLVFRIPERRNATGTRWVVAATDATVEAIHRSWPRERIKFTEASETVFDYYLATLQRKDVNADRLKAYTNDGEVPTHTLEMHPRFPLAPYQQVGLVNACGTEGFALFMEQGTGKTPVVIARVCNEARQLRTGALNATELNRNEAQLRAQLDANLQHAKQEIEQEAEYALKRKREKLERGAKRKALNWPVEYTGIAAHARAAADRAVHEAEMWLAKRLQEIDREMRDIELAHADLVWARIDLAQREILDEHDANVARLRAKRAGGEDRLYRCIIVTPNNVRMNWVHEFERFKTCQGRAVVVRGNDLQRVKLLVDAFKRRPGDEFVAIIMSYDTLVASWAQVKILHWDLAVLDESHYIKTPTAKRTKTAMQLRDRATARMCLTGTPITNHPLDLFSQFEFLGEGWSGFRSWKAFRSFYGVYQTTSAGYEKLVDCQNMPFMQARLARQSFAVKKVDALPDLPEKVYDVVEVEMTPPQAECYKTMATELVVELEEYIDGAENAQLAANHVLTKLLRLAQITSGHAVIPGEYDDEGEEVTPRRVIQFDNNPKIAALLELLQSHPENEKALVWGCWVEDIKAISRALTDAGIKHVTFYGATSDSERERAEWTYNNDPTCRVFIGNPAAGGTGLNLLGYPPGNGEAHTTNTAHEIYFSQNWSPTARSQSEDRGHRRGTRVHVRITDLCVPGTIDEDIRTRVLEKRMNADRITDVRAILKSLKGVE